MFFCSLVLCFSASAVYADGVCDKTQYRDSARLVNSLRLEKPGQARAFAFDGSEFNGGQVLWMKGQLRKFDRLCTRDGVGDEAEAARTLAGIRELIDSHQRRS
jgi:hypothetical protein